MKLQRRRESVSTGFTPSFDVKSTAPLTQQLYLALRSAVAEGRLAAGQRLPSTRMASKEWKLSRGTVSEAYENLLAEGFVIARRGSGTYVASRLTQISSGEAAKAREDERPRRLSAPAVAVLTSGPSLEPQKLLPFATGRIAHDERTARLLNRIAVRNLDYSFEGYGDVQGDRALREAISAHLAATRGVRSTANEIFVTAGTQQALDLVFRVLINPGETAVVEDPCYPPARQCLALNGAIVVALPVDNDGIELDQLFNLAIDPPALVYVTPSNQYPVGSVLSLPRRMELLSYANQQGCWIVEDDYDSEFRYEGRPIASLQGLDQHSRVIYTGTFSKAILPSLRIGFLVVPEDLVPVFRAIRPALDRCAPTFQQRVIADFMNEGYFPAHLRRLRESLRDARDMLAHFIRGRLAEHVEFSPPDQGINIVVRSRHERSSDVDLSAAALKRGVVVMPLSRMNIERKDSSRLLLGFSGLSEKDADRGTRILSKIFDIRV